MHSIHQEFNGGEEMTESKLIEQLVGSLKAIDGMLIKYKVNHIPSSIVNQYIQKMDAALAAVEEWRKGKAPEAENKLKWQPIESAYRNKTPILGIDANNNCSICEWDSDNNRWLALAEGDISIMSAGDDYMDFHEPDLTHWMPLPSPPEMKG